MTINKSDIIKSLPVFMAFFVMGFVDVVGIATSYVKHDFNLSDTTASLLPMMVFIWFAILSLPTGLLQNKYGKKRVLNIGIAFTFLAMILPFVWYSFPVVLGSFVLIGIGNTIIQVAANPLLHDISSSENYSSNMSLSQLVKSLASLLGPILSTWMALKFGSWRYIFVFYFVVSLLNYLWLSKVDILEKPTEKNASFKDSISLLKNKNILLLTLSILAIVGLDVGINTNIVSILQTKFQLSIEDASMGIKIYFLSLIFARFGGAVILKKMNSLKFMLASLIIGLVSLIALYWVSDLNLALTLIVLIGFGTANVFPIIFSKAIELMPSRANEISGLMIMSVCGGALFPFIMGLVSDNFGTINSVIVRILCVLFIFFVGIQLYFKSDKVRINKV